MSLIDKTNNLQPRIKELENVHPLLRHTGEKAALHFQVAKRCN